MSLAFSLSISPSLSLVLVRSRLLSLASPFGLSLSLPLPLSLFPLRQLATALSRSYLLPLTLSLSLPMVSVWRAVPSHVGWMACSPLHRLLVGRAILSCVSLVCSPSRPSIPRLSWIGTAVVPLPLPLSLPPTQIGVIRSFASGGLGLSPGAHQGQPWELRTTMCAMGELSTEGSPGRCRTLAERCRESGGARA